MEPPQPSPRPLVGSSPAADPDRSSASRPADPDAPEKALIRTLLADRPPAPAWLRLDVGHDCAVVDADGPEALSVDALVEGVHWDARLSAADVGYKAVAVSVSDLAAARARPRWLLLALSLPRARTAWAAELAEGLHAACREHRIALVGGDLTGMREGGPIVLSTTAGGALLGAPRSRAGARPGDVLWVTGWPGLAGLGWMVADPPEEALAALRRPAVPLAFALALDVATAAMDLSDGLAADAPRLAEASGVSIALDAEALPVHPALRDAPERLRHQLRGGDDLQLLFTAASAAEGRVRDLAARYAVPVQPIGRISAGSGVELVGAAWPAPAFSHFGASP